MPRLRARDIVSGLGQAVGQQGMDFLGGKSLSGLGSKYKQQKFFKMLKQHGDLSSEHQKMAGELATGSKFKAYTTDKVRGFTNAIFRLGKAGKLSGYGVTAAGRSVGTTTLVKRMAAAGGPDAQQLAQQKKQQEFELRKQRAIRLAQFQRQQESERAAVPAKPGSGNQAAPLAPLTSVSRVPTERGGPQKVVSVGEATPPGQEPPAPSGSVGPLKGSQAGEPESDRPDSPLASPASAAEQSPPTVPGTKDTGDDDASKPGDADEAEEIMI